MKILAMKEPEETTVTPEPAAQKVQISDQTYDYYKRVYYTFKDINEAEDQDVFFTNVFRQLRSEALVVCQHKVLSYNIEEMLKFARPKHLYMLWRAFVSDWMEVCTDAYASHVFHNLVLCFPMTFDLDIATLSVNEEGNDSEENKMEESGEKVSITSAKRSKKSGAVTCPRKMFLGFCSFIEEHFDEMIKDTYATHIVRAVLQVLANIPVDNNITVIHHKKAENNKVKLHKSKPDETFHKQFFTISKLIIKSPNFSEYICLKNSNPVIQLILKLTFQLRQDKGEKLCKKMIRSCGFFDVPPVDSNTHLTDSNRLPNLMMDVYATYLVQLLLEHCSEEIFLAWYESSFQNRLIAYAVHKHSNYVLQHVIDRCSSKHMFNLVFDEITPYIEDMLSMKHIGVVKCLLQRCLSLGIKQKKIVKKLLDAFHCADDNKQIMIVPLLLVMKTYEVYMDNIILEEKVENPEKFAKFIINIHGSRIVQTLFNFRNPKIFVESFLHLTPKQMVSVMCQFYGNFIIRDFFKSSTIAEKNKDAVLQKLSGSYSDIACDKVGSRSWQGVWYFLNVKQKIAIAEELCQNVAKIKGSTYGIYVYKHIALDTFQVSRQQWETSQGALSNKRKMFDDILDSSPVGKKSKKSKVKKKISANKKTDEVLIS